MHLCDSNPAAWNVLAGNDIGLMLSDTQNDTGFTKPDLKSIILSVFAIIFVHHPALHGSNAQYVCSQCEIKVAQPKKSTDSSRTETGALEEDEEASGAAVEEVNASRNDKSCCCFHEFLN